MPLASRILVRRAASSSDAQALRSILYDTFETTWLPQLTPAAAQRYRDEDRPLNYVNARGEKFWVAECDGQVIAFIDWDADFVNALHVRRDQARQGIGGLLMDLAEAKMASAGFPAARLETDTFNTRSRAFYAKRGYLEADRYPDLEWDSGLTTLLMVKDLNNPALTS